MKWFIYIFVMILLSVFLFGESTRKIASKNEFGGVTREFNYKKGDDYFDKIGITKAIVFYDKEGKYRKSDYFFTKESAVSNTYDRKTEYYNENQKLSNREYFFTQAVSDKNGYFRAFDSYDDAGDITRTDYFYTDKYAAKEGYTNVVFLMANGFIRQRDYFFTEKFANANKYAKRSDFYVYDSYAKEQLKEQVFFDKDGKEVKRIKLIEN